MSTIGSTTCLQVTQVGAIDAAVENVDDDDAAGDGGTTTVSRVVSSHVSPSDGVLDDNLAAPTLRASISGFASSSDNGGNGESMSSAAAAIIFKAVIR